MPLKNNVFIDAMVAFRWLVGFRTKCSSLLLFSTKLDTLERRIILSSASKNVSMNFEKAFDSLDRNDWLQKLHAYGLIDFIELLTFY